MAEMTAKQSRRRPAVAGLFLIALVGGAGLLLAPTPPAQAAPARQATAVPTELLMSHLATQSAEIQAAQDAALQATPAPDGGGSSGSGSGTGTSGAGGIVTSITQIFHIIQFPFKTMTEAVIKMVNSILTDAYAGARDVFAGALDRMVFNDYGIAPRSLGSTTRLFADFVRPSWDITFTMALLLLPATLTLTAVSAMRLGASSVLGYADLKESLIGWLISAGAAAASFYLLNLAHRLSLAASRAILFANFGETIDGFTLAGALFPTGVLAAASALLPVVGLYVMFFFVFLASTVLLGLGMALAAYIALAYVLSVIAPVVIVLGALPPLRWLHSLWLKAITVTFLVPLADALLLRAALFLATGTANAAGHADLGSFVSGLFIMAGVISLLITINFKVGEVVFGALGEVHKRAWESTIGVVNMALTAAGLVAGYGLATSFAQSGGAALMGSHMGPGLPPTPPAGPGGGDLAAPSAAPASAAGHGSGPMPAGGGPSSPTGQGSSGGVPALPRSSNGDDSRASPSTALSSDPGLQRRAAELAQNAGRALTMGAANPLLRAMGLGGMVGGAVQGYRASLQLDSQAAQEKAHMRQQREEDRAATAAYRPNIMSRQPAQPRDAVGTAYPGELSGRGGDAQATLARHLGRQTAAPLNAVIGVNDMLYGALQRSGVASPQAIQELYEIYGNQSRDPAAFADGVQRWSERNQVSLPADWRTHLRGLFPG